MIDTSVLIALGEQVESVIIRFDSLITMPTLSVLTVVELEGGLALRTGEERHRRYSLFQEIKATMAILDFGTAEASRYGEIVKALGFSRAKIIDRMIAAQALVAGASLATLNPRDFSKIAGLTVEDWS